ncbi:tetracycline resistance MFS efflux pump [Actinomycetes bacterium]|nr:tetracycline resistance MFS efflux pump [Actinomycetes bacterium]
MRKNPMLAIFTTVFIDLLGFGILIPVFPLLISPGSPFRVTPEGWSFTQGLIMLGWLQAIYPFCIFVAAPILGQMSDRHGRRPVLAASIFGTSVGYVLFAIGISTANIPLLFAARALDGITGGNLAVAQAAIGDVSTNENRAKNFGLLGAAFGLGFIIGPYLGGRLSSPDTSFYGLFHTPSWFGATTPFWFAAIIALANAVSVLVTFPETLKEKFHGGRIKMGRAVSNVVAGFKSDRLRVILATGFLFNAGFTFFTTFFGVYLRNSFDFTSAKIGDYFALVGLFIAFSQAVVVARVAKKLADFKVLRFSLFGTAAMMLVYFLTPTSSSAYLYMVIPFFTFFNGLTMANMSSLVSRSAEPGQQGQAMGIYSSVQSLAQVPASILVGYITSGINSSQPLLVSSVCIGLGGFVFATMFRPKYVSETVARAGAPVH